MITTGCKTREGCIEVHAYRKDETIMVQLTASHGSMMGIGSGKLELGDFLTGLGLTADDCATAITAFGARPNPVQIPCEGGTQSTAAPPITSPATSDVLGDGAEGELEDELDDFGGDDLDDEDAGAGADAENVEKSTKTLTRRKGRGK